MKKISLKQAFEQRQLADCYAAIVRSNGKEPTSGDEFAEAILSLRQKNDAHLQEVCQIAASLEQDAYFDAVNYLIVQYEAKGRYTETENRIELLSEIMEYSYIKEYVVELACLYLSMEKPSRARRLISR